MSRRSTRNPWSRKHSMSNSPTKVNMNPGEGDRESDEDTTIRITVVGDGFTGKTCLLIGYKDKKFDDYYIPTVFDSYSMNISIYNKNFRLILQDTAGQEDYDKLRPLGYTRTDVFIICYSIDRRDSYQNVLFKWAKEVRHYRPKCKIILVATKIDMKDTLNDPLTLQDGLDLQEKIRADDFLECSAKELFNVDNVFGSALMASVTKPQMRKSRQCVIL